MFENRHFDFKRKSWHIGNDAEAKRTVHKSIKSFYEKLTSVMLLSEKIRELDAQFSEIKEFSEVKGATADEVHMHIMYNRSSPERLSQIKPGSSLSSGKRKNKSHSFVL